MSSKRQRAAALFSRFVEMLRAHDLSEADEIFAPDIAVFTTHLGNVNGCQQAKQLWSWKGKPVGLERYLIFNHVLRENRDICAESCYLFVQSGFDEGTYYHHFNYGFYFANTYAADAMGELKMTEMRCQLDVFEGNTAIVEGWWRPVNPQLYSGYQVPAIISLYDAPWRKVEEDQNYSDEEAVCDVLFRYAWGNDHGDMPLLDSCINVDYCVDYGAKGRISSPRAFIELSTQVRFKEYYMQHLYRVTELEVLGNTAHAVFYRHEPHRIGSRMLTVDNRDGIFFSARYDIYLVKTAAGWQWNHGSYAPGLTYCELVPESETKRLYFR